MGRDWLHTPPFKLHTLALEINLQQLRCGMTHLLLYLSLSLSLSPAPHAFLPLSPLCAFDGVVLWRRSQGRL